jgi:maleamate amidohydrolase
MSKDAFERDRKFYQEHGFGGRIGFGKKPAVIVIDLQLGFTDPTCPLGGDLDRVVQSCRELIFSAHQKQIPVFFTACAYEEHLKDSGLWGKKVPALSWLKVGSKWVEIDPRLGKTPEDILVIKKYPSGFFGTHLQATLTSMGIDTPDYYRLHNQRLRARHIYRCPSVRLSRNSAGRVRRRQSGGAPFGKPFRYWTEVL